jgi:hypothetical protein
MTSANVTEYLISDKYGKVVGIHHQHHYCKTHWENLNKFSPPEDYFIQATWEDEEENYHEGKKINLKDFWDEMEDHRKKSEEGRARFRADKLNMSEIEFRKKYNLL